jgi:hypothetical protein
VRSLRLPAQFTLPQKLLLLLLNAVPLLHVCATAATALLLPATPMFRMVAALAVFFCGPPLLARMLRPSRLPLGHLAVGVPSLGFFRWWTLWQLQGVFNRLPSIEETLRLIPGVYSLWLRLWGARIGRLTLWSPGVRVFDRSLLDVGDDVVFGLDVRVVGHFGDLDAEGRPRLTLGRTRIDDGCTVGAASLLGPGCHLDASQVTEVLFLGSPFTRWTAGTRLPSGK